MLVLHQAVPLTIYNEIALMNAQLFDRKCDLSI